MEGEGWTCPTHGPILPLWRPDTPTYDDLADHLGRVDGIPTLAPWPMRPGWAISDFGSVTGEPGLTRATFLSCAGSTDADGVVEVTVVFEEPQVGLGARVAVIDQSDPGTDVDGPPPVRISVQGREVALWSVSTSARDVDFDRSVFAGEAQGRWVWLVLRPASAALMLTDGWEFEDLGSLGPALLEVDFIDVPKPW